MPWSWWLRMGWDDLSCVGTHIVPPYTRLLSGISAVLHGTIAPRLPATSQCLFNVQMILPICSDGVMWHSLNVAPSHVIQSEWGICHTSIVTVWWLWWFTVKIHVFLTLFHILLTIFPGKFLSTTQSVLFSPIHKISRQLIPVHLSENQSLHNLSISTAKHQCVWITSRMLHARLPNASLFSATYPFQDVISILLMWQEQSDLPTRVYTATGNIHLWMGKLWNIYIYIYKLYMYIHYMCIYIIIIYTYTAVYIYIHIYIHTYIINSSIHK